MADQAQIPDVERPRGTRPQLIAGRYEVLGTIGQGPTGRVFRVKDHRDEARPTALTILLADRTDAPDFERRFEDFFRRRRGLEHPTLPTVREVGRTELGLFFYAYDHVEGETLADHLAKSGASDAALNRGLARQTLEGLAIAQAAGLVHGDLRGDNLLLEAPGTTNGSRELQVRLLDFGLENALFRPDAEQRTGRDDLIALEGLFGESLGPARGLSLDPSVEGADVLLDQLSRPSPAAPPSVSGTPAAKPTPRPGPAGTRSAVWPYVGVLVLALAVFFGLRDRGAPEVAASPAQEPVRPPPSDPGPSGAAVRTLESQIARLNQELEALRDDLGSWRGRAEEAEARSAELTGYREESLARMAQLERDLAAARQSIVEFEVARDETRRAQDPNYLGAFYLDRILEQVQEGSGEAALDLVRSMKNEAAIMRHGLNGMDFVEELARCAWELERSRSSEDELAESDRLGEAWRLVEGIQEKRDLFFRESAHWVATEIEGLDQDRPDQVDAAISDLLGSIGRAKQSLGHRFRERWAELERTSVDRDPEEVLSIARWIGEERLGPFLSRYRQLVAQTEVDGELDLEALREVRSLAAWGEAIAADPELARTEDGQEILFFRYALRWYMPWHEGEGRPPIDWGPYPASAALQRGGWRAQMVLKTRLLGASSGFPGPVGSRFLYHRIDANGTAGWELERVFREEPRGSESRWRIQVERFAADGTPLAADERLLVQRGKRFTLDSQDGPEWLDLRRSGSRFRIRVWNSIPKPEVPHNLPLDRVLLESFQRRLGEENRECLVVQDGFGAHWYSPQLGLVLREEADGSTHELVYAELPR